MDAPVYSYSYLAELDDNPIGIRRYSYANSLEEAFDSAVEISQQCDGMPVTIKKKSRSGTWEKVETIQAKKLDFGVV